MSEKEVWTNETLTDDIVEKSVCEVLQEMEKVHKDWVTLKSRLEMVKNVYTVYYSPQGQKDLYELWRIRDKLVDILKQYACCSDGCAWCCHMAVGITSLDAERIYKATGIKPRVVVMNVNGLFVDRDGQIRKYMKVPCPFLSNGRCTIYEDRPSACRTHFNMSKFPQVCDLETFAGRDVPNIDMTDLWVAEAMICYKLGATMGDIRVYFPHVNEGVESKD